MNKQDLVNAIAEGADIPKTTAEAALKATLDAITKEMASGGTVTLVGFGSFSVKERAARTGRNPQTGKSIEISAAKIPTFKAGSQLKEAANS